MINKHDQYYYIAKFNLDHNKKKSNLCHYGVLVKVPFLLFFFRVRRDVHGEVWCIDLCTLSCWRSSVEVCAHAHETLGHVILFFFVRSRNVPQQQVAQWSTVLSTLPRVTNRLATILPK